jgi:hypothetical protein
VKPETTTAAVEDAGEAEIAIAGTDLAHVVDFYWLSLSKFQNLLEDIEGADHRLEYLKSLRYQFIVCLQEMDGILTGGVRRVGTLHMLSYALQMGVGFLGMSGPQLAAAVRLHDELEYAELQDCLLRLGKTMIARLPGAIPAAQGGQGQREVLRAMRVWSAAAKEMGEDLSFLASRLREL